jgi:hypothetical protein
MIHRAFVQGDGNRQIFKFGAEFLVEPADLRFQPVEPAHYPSEECSVGRYQQRNQAADDSESC